MGGRLCVHGCVFLNIFLLFFIFEYVMRVRPTSSGLQGLGN